MLNVFQGLDMELQEIFAFLGVGFSLIFIYLFSMSQSCNENVYGKHAHFFLISVKDHD